MAYMISTYGGPHKRAKMTSRVGGPHGNSAMPPITVRSNEINYSCGVFTILSMYLLSCGHALSRYSYTQQLIYANKTRLKIAHLIWQKDERTVLEARSNVRNWMIGLGSDTRRKSAAVPQAQPSKKKRKRTNSEKRVTIGGTKVARAKENTGRGESMWVAVYLIGSARRNQ